MPRLQTRAPYRPVHTDKGRCAQEYVPRVSERRPTRHDRKKPHSHRGGVFYPFSDSDFDGKQPVEVIQLMSRAKRWLESRGYEITLKGCYNVRKEIKF